MENIEQLKLTTKYMESMTKTDRQRAISALRSLWLRNRTTKIIKKLLKETVKNNLSLSFFNERLEEEQNKISVKAADDQINAFIDELLKTTQGD